MSNPEDNPDKSDGKEIQLTGFETNTQSQAETPLSSGILVITKNLDSSTTPNQAMDLKSSTMNEKKINRARNYPLLS